MQALGAAMDDLSMGRPIAAFQPQAPRQRSAGVGPSMQQQGASPGYGGGAPLMGGGGYGGAGPAPAYPGHAVDSPVGGGGYVGQAPGVPSYGPPPAYQTQVGYGGAPMQPQMPMGGQYGGAPPMQGGGYQQPMAGGYQQPPMQQMPQANAGYNPSGGHAFLN